MFKPRKQVQYKLPPGRYILNWSTEKVPAKWEKEPYQGTRKDPGFGKWRRHCPGEYQRGFHSDVLKAGIERPYCVPLPLPVPYARALARKCDMKNSNNVAFWARPRARARARATPDS